MTDLSANGAARANECNRQSATESSSDCQSANEPSDWFGNLARPLLQGADAAYSLYLLTGFRANTCSRYVARTEASRRQPPGYFILALLRSEQGGIWLNAFMGGYEPAWWRDNQIKLRKAALYDQARQIFSQFG